MSLFHPLPRPSMFRPRYRRVTVLQPINPRLPQSYAHLTSICSNPGSHPLPVSRKFIGFATSESGAPIAVYACPLCNSRIAFARDFASGRPRVLFTRPADK
jgi:hypothetical protein